MSIFSNSGVPAWKAAGIGLAHSNQQGTESYSSDPKNLTGLGVKQLQHTALSGKCSEGQYPTDSSAYTSATTPDALIQITCSSAPLPIINATRRPRADTGSKRKLIAPKGTPLHQRILTSLHRVAASVESAEVCDLVLKSERPKTLRTFPQVTDVDLLLVWWVALELSQRIYEYLASEQYSKRGEDVAEWDALAIAKRAVELAGRDCPNAWVVAFVQVIGRQYHKWLEDNAQFLAQLTQVKTGGDVDALRESAKMVGRLAKRAVSAGPSSPPVIQFPSHRGKAEIQGRRAGRRKYKSRPSSAESEAA